MCKKILIVDIALTLEELDEFLDVFRLDKSNKLSIFGDGEEIFPFVDLEHIANFFGDDDLSFCPDGDRSVHTHIHHRSSRFFS